MPARLKLFLPLILFGVLAAFLMRGLELDPKALPSALIDKPLPAFSLPALGSGDILDREAVTGRAACSMSGPPGACPAGWNTRT